ncbi:MAG TPA: hypothetical protein DCM05_18150 [Elusimicrobia bacterium]|nr:hypothetical protein [Elusimicrobiota bacterium]
MIFSGAMLKLFLALFAPLCWAQPSASVTGYVVKVESATVYLEFGESQGIRPGQKFTLFSEGEELKHPVTGASLGRVQNLAAEGTVTEVQEKYSVGALSTAVQPLPQGLKFKLALTPAPSAAVLRSDGPTAPSGSAVGRPPLRKSPLLDLEAVDLAFGDVDGDGKAEALLAAKDAVDAFSVDEFKPVCRFKDKATAVQFLSLDAEDLDGDGRAEVFVTLNNSFFGRVETYALACSSGVFQKAKTLPWMVRRFQDGTGSALAAQQLNDDGTFPFGSLHRLRFEDGQYALSKEKLGFPRVEWLYGFGAARDGELVFPYFLTMNNRIRLQFDKKKHWSTKEAYAQTSNRIRWRERLLQFNPRILAKNDGNALAGLYVVHNVPRFGALSDAFGSYTGSELHFLRWGGMSLASEWKTDLPGYAPGLADVPGRPELGVAVVGANGKTSVWFFPR